MRALASTVVLLLAASAASAQITTGTVTGTVVDPQGAVIPGATIVLLSETQGTRTAPVVSNAEGSYTVPAVKADVYTVEVSMPSFKPLSRKGVRVSAGERVSVESLVLQIGTQTETITVEAQAPVIQAASGERSGVVESAQLANLPISATSHNFADFLTLVPGVATNGNTAQKIGGGGQANYQIDGISAMDTGNNGLMGGLNLPIDAIAEVKVITSGYQAEYGRSSGLQVSAVTKSGTNQFHGAVYDYERHSRWNENSWANQRNGTPKAVSDQRDWGYVIGGPVGKPGGSNKLFFFNTIEFQPRQTGNNESQFRVPTALERRGDFSQTLDNNGALYPYIKDPNISGTCSATNTAACFKDGGVVGRIPLNRLYGPGLAILNQYPLPTVTQASGTSYNYSVLSPVQNTLTFIPAYRLDYQATQRLRITGKWDGRTSRVVPNIGTIPGYNDTIQNFPLAFNSSGTVNYSLNPTTFLEATYGMNQNRLGSPPTGTLSNRYNVVCPSDLSALVGNCAVGALPFPFSGDVPINSDYYEAKALKEIGVPFLVGNTLQLQPLYTFNGTRLSGNTCIVNGNSGQNCAPPNLTFPGFMNINRTQDFVLSVTKIMGTHTAKAGFYLNHSYKAQNFGAGGNGAPSFQGALAFNVNTSNPLETSFPYSNAAIGVFNTYGQQSNFVEGSFLYNNVEWYLQDNWKRTRKLTLDYGIRFIHQTPQYDQFNQVATFLPEEWKLSAAPFMYVPGCVGGAATCTGNNRQAKDPRTGALLGAGSSSLIGQVILGSGDGANGMRQAGNGIANTGYVWPWLAVAPRFGFAYDVSGQQKWVTRGSIGLFYDRPDGNSVFSTVGNPPVATSTQSQWGTLAGLANSQFKFGPVPILTTYQYDSPLPKDLQWSGGIQIALPWQSALDVEYTGHHNFDIIGLNGPANSINVNAVDLGKALPGSSGVDTTVAGGTTPLPDNLLRSYRGYGNINRNTAAYWREAHSIQSSFTRRFSHGLSFGVNYTYLIGDKSNAFGAGGSPALRINHNADGSWYVRDDQAQAQELFGKNIGTTVHSFKANFVWSLPTLTSEEKALKALGHLINDWQLTGIASLDSGGFYDIGYSYQSGNTTTALTGSPDYAARIILNNMAALGSGCSGDQYQQIANTMAAATSGASPMRSTAIAGPQVGSVGLESGRNLFHACGLKNLDLAIQRNIRVGGGRSLQFRLDVFNVFNTVIFNARNTTVQFNSPTDLTVRNSQFLADGSIDPARAKPNNSGFGAATGAINLRQMQMQIRFTF